MSRWGEGGGGEPVMFILFLENSSTHVWLPELWLFRTAFVFEIGDLVFCYLKNTKHEKREIPAARAPPARFALS